MNDIQQAIKAGNTYLLEMSNHKYTYLGQDDSGCIVGKCVTHDDNPSFLVVHSSGGRCLYQCSTELTLKKEQRVRNIRLTEGDMRDGDIRFTHAPNAYALGDNIDGYYTTGYIKVTEELRKDGSEETSKWVVIKTEICN